VELVAQRLRDPLLQGYSAIALGACGHFSYRFREAREHFRRAEQVLVLDRSHADWELNIVRHIRIFGALYLGEHRSYEKELEQYVAEARHKNDLYALNVWQAAPRIYPLLIAGAGEEALASARRSLEGWPSDAY